MTQASGAPGRIPPYVIVLEDSETKGSTRNVAAAIASYARRDGTAWPALDSIAHRARVSQSTARRAIAKLKEAGELRVDFKAGKRGCNLYTLTAVESAHLSIVGDTNVSTQGEHVGPVQHEDTSGPDGPNGRGQTEPAPSHSEPGRVHPELLPVHVGDTRRSVEVQREDQKEVQARAPAADGGARLVSADEALHVTRQSYTVDAAAATKIAAGLDALEAGEAAEALEVLPELADYCGDDPLDAWRRAVKYLRLCNDGDTESMTAAWEAVIPEAAA